MLISACNPMVCPIGVVQASQEIGWDAHQAFKASKEFSAARHSTEITAFMEEAFRIQSMMKDAAQN